MANIKNQYITNCLILVGEIKDYFILSSLSLTLKSNSNCYIIHFLLYPYNYSSNCHLPKKRAVFEYSTFDEVKEEVVRTSPRIIIVQNNLKNTL